MKNIIKLTVLLLLVSMSCISSFAVNPIYGSDNEDVESEVIFTSESVFTEFQKQNIIKHFNGTEDHTVSVQGILCLFGHNLTTESCKYITHRYYESIPRCLQETYDVSTCSRCDYTSSSFVSSTRIGCCS